MSSEPLATTERLSENAKRATASLTDVASKIFDYVIVGAYLVCCFNQASVLRFISYSGGGVQYLLLSANGCSFTEPFIFYRPQA